MGDTGFGLEERILHTKDEFAQREALLRSRGLTPPGDEEFVIGLYEGEMLVATGALVRNVLQGIAVDVGYEGEGAASAIVSSLLKRAVRRGLSQIFLYTTNEEASRFEALGFSLIAAVPRGAALLEWGSQGIGTYLESLRAIAIGRLDHSGAVVVNCNPFTLGHRALIEYASSRVPWLYVLVVEEDRSLFPFGVRFQLIREGTADLPNVTVIKGGPYIISSATFPTYFVRPDREEASQRTVNMHAALDLAIFRKYVAPALRVTERFVGTEPYCSTTSIYNETMKRILPSSEPEGFDSESRGVSIAVREMPRFEIDGAAVSASKIRDLIREGRLPEVEKLVPRTTWEWLTSEEAVPVVEKIRNSDSRH
jgi:[citrate (pro-3S)-lyase] ligase